MVTHGTEPASAVPGLGELSVEVDPFQDLGQRGHLLLAFANGRLYQAVFSPATPGEYLAGVEGLTGAVLPAPGEVWFDPSTRVHLVNVGGQGPRVTWEDECIAEGQHQNDEMGGTSCRIPATAQRDTPAQENSARIAK